MTNHWSDVKNARTIMVLGANPVENHPVVTQYMNTAMADGAKLIVADPRKTRTAQMADVFTRIRPGTNGAFLMGLINYVIQNKLYDAAYQTATATRAFTNAAGQRVDKLVPKWTDARFRLDAPNRTDYLRENASWAQTPTTMTAASVIGALVIEVASRVNLSIGTEITIGTGGTQETRTLTSSTRKSVV